MGDARDRITVLFDSAGYQEPALGLVEEQDGLLVHETAGSA